MKYLKKYKIFENKIQDLEDILQELKDENFKINVEDNFKGGIKISISIRDEKGIHGFGGLIPFKFNVIEEYVRRIIDFLNINNWLYCYSFKTYGIGRFGSCNHLINKKLDDLSDDTIILFDLWVEKNKNKND